jgi:hypothetical protein
VLNTIMNASAAAEPGYGLIPPSRFVVVTRGGSGVKLGFNLIDEDDDETWAVRGQYIQLTDQLDSPCRSAGVLTGDLIISIDGHQVLGKSHDDVVDLIQAAGTSFSLELGTWSVALFVRAGVSTLYSRPD